MTAGTSWEEGTTVWATVLSFAVNFQVPWVCDHTLFMQDVAGDDDDDDEDYHWNKTEKNFDSFFLLSLHIL